MSPNAGLGRAEHYIIVSPPYRYNTCTWTQEHGELNVVKSGGDGYLTLIWILIQFI